MEEPDYAKENESLSKEIKMTKEQIELLQMQLKQQENEVERRHAEKEKLFLKVKEAGDCAPIIDEIQRLESRLAELTQNIERLQNAAPDQEKERNDKIKLVASFKEQAQAIRAEQAQLRDDVAKLDNLRDEIAQLQGYLKAISLGTKRSNNGGGNYQDLLSSFSSIISSQSQTSSDKK